MALPNTAAALDTPVTSSAWCGNHCSAAVLPLQNAGYADSFTYNLDALCQILGYSRRDTLVSVLRREYVENVDYIRQGDNKDLFRRKQTFMVTAECARLLTYRCSSRNLSRPSTPAAVADVKLTHIRRYHPKEEEVMGFVIRVYTSSFRCQSQHAIGRYRVDALIDERIVVECDEKGHGCYDPVAEEERQLYLENHGFTIYRFNPDSNDFDLAKVVSDLNALLY